MKKFYFTLLFSFITTLFFAQGISVQGIARDNASSAIANTNLTFTFSITKDDNSVLYAETQSIRTDNFGVFSHIFSTGNPVTNTFNDIDFEIKDLKLKVSVNYNSNEIEVYNQTLQSTPYAHYAKKATVATIAENGVPTGSIIPFAGAIAPKGWVLCNGQSISGVEGGDALRALIGVNAPDLKGMFLRGTGTNSVNSKDGPTLRGTQGDTFKSHGHNASVTIGNDGQHTHSIVQLPYDNIPNGGNRRSLTDTTGDDESFQPISGGGNALSTDGSHSHPASASISNTGDAETRPVSYGVNYIIKL
jgi:microcystin-dependent protein